MSVKSPISMRFECVICCIFALLLSLGCSRQGVRYAPVAGTVTIDGKPIRRAEVVLSCEETTVRPRPTTRGVTDDAGRLFYVRSRPISN